MLQDSQVIGSNVEDPPAYEDIQLEMMKMMINQAFKMDPQKYNQPLKEPELIKCPNIECSKFNETMNLHVQQGNPENVPFKQGAKYECQKCH